MEMRQIPLGKPQSLVRLPDDRLYLRLTSADGERRATQLRDMTARDALAQPRFWRSST